MRYALLLLALAAAPAAAQTRSCPGGGEAEVAALARANGGPAAFPPQALDALTAFVRVERALCDNDLGRARNVLDQLWSRMPVGGDRWGFDYFTNGTHAGTPTAYYALRIMDDIVEHERRTGRPAPPDTAVFAIVMASCAEGVQPRTLAELRGGTGTRVRRELHPRLRASDYRLLREVTDLFRRYTEAMTRGRLALKLRFVEVPTCVAVRFPETWSQGPIFVRAEWGMLYNDGGLEELQDADWFWAIVPSLEPHEYPDFARSELVGGGMARHVRGGPLFLSDDRWVLERPNHLGRGTYTDLERRAYLPQWLQHEFFHHLFLRYPDLRLEARSHQWFDRATWPSDFTGRFEPDYYAEALHRRLQQATPALGQALRYAAPSRRVFASLSPDDVAGTYVREPFENGYHRGRITLEAGGAMRWANEAGVSWALTPDLANGRLNTGPDNPYHAAGATTFELVAAQGPDGRWLPRVHAFRFQGELYLRR